MKRQLKGALVPGLWQEDEEDIMPVKVMDWEQDEPILFPAINQVAGCEVRSVPYIHWWTFVGYFMEIREGIFPLYLGSGRKWQKVSTWKNGKENFVETIKDL